MLASAGLHTAALSGFVFFFFRIAIAAWPWLALRVPGKKIAALAGLLAVGAYLVLSGAHPPARRAAITASVAFAAILLDRRAVSLHSLAIAALIILLIEPDVVVQPGGITIGVDLDLAAGGFLLVTGPNGSGKTTLLRVLAGLAAPSASSAALNATRQCALISSRLRAKSPSAGRRA